MKPFVACPTIALKS